MTLATAYQGGFDFAVQPPPAPVPPNSPGPAQHPSPPMQETSQWEPLNEDDLTPEELAAFASIRQFGPPHSTATSREHTYLEEAQDVMADLSSAVQARGKARMWLSLTRAHELRPSVPLFSVLDITAPLCDHRLWQRAGAAGLRDETLISWWEYLSEEPDPAGLPWLGGTFGDFRLSVLSMASLLAQVRHEDASTHDAVLAVKLASRGINTTAALASVNVEDLRWSMTMGVRQRQNVKQLVELVSRQSQAQTQALRRCPRGQRSSSPAHLVPSVWAE